MDEFIIREWNNIITDDDTAYHVGDFSNKNQKYAEEVLGQLKGNKFLCIGNHDKHMRKLSGYFKEMKDSFIVEVDGGQTIFLSHFLHRNNWPGANCGSWHLFGHSHGRKNSFAEQNGKMLDVGVDSHDFRPWSLSEVVEIMAKRPLDLSDVKRRSFKK